MRHGDAVGSGVRVPQRDVDVVHFGAHRIVGPVLRAADGSVQPRHVGGNGRAERAVIGHPAIDAVRPDPVVPGPALVGRVVREQHEEVGRVEHARQPEIGVVRLNHLVARDIGGRLPGDRVAARVGGIARVQTAGRSRRLPGRAAREIHVIHVELAGRIRGIRVRQEVEQSHVRCTRHAGHVPHQLLPRPITRVVLHPDIRVIDLHQDGHVEFRRAHEPCFNKVVAARAQIAVVADAPRRRLVRGMPGIVLDARVIPRLVRPRHAQRLLPETGSRTVVVLKERRQLQHEVGRTVPPVEVGLIGLERRVVRGALELNVIDPEGAGVGSILRRHHKDNLRDRGHIDAVRVVGAAQVEHEILPVGLRRSRARLDPRPARFEETARVVLEPDAELQRTAVVVDPETQVVVIPEVEQPRGREEAVDVRVVPLVVVHFQRDDTGMDVLRAAEIERVGKRRRRIVGPPERHLLHPVKGLEILVAELRRRLVLHRHPQRRGERAPVGADARTHPVVPRASARQRIRDEADFRSVGPDHERTPEARIVIGFQLVVLRTRHRVPPELVDPVAIRILGRRPETQRRVRHHRHRAAGQVQIVHVQHAAVVRLVRVRDQVQLADVRPARHRADLPAHVLPRAAAGVGLVAHVRVVELEQQRDRGIRRTAHPQLERVLPAGAEVGEEPHPPARRAVRIVRRFEGDVGEVLRLRAPRNPERALPKAVHTAVVEATFRGVGDDKRRTRRPAVEIGFEDVQRCAVRRPVQRDVIHPELARRRLAARLDHEHDLADLREVDVAVEVAEKGAGQVDRNVLPVRLRRHHLREDRRPIRLPCLAEIARLLETHLDAQRRAGVVDPEGQVVEIQQVVLPARREEAVRVGVRLPFGVQTHFVGLVERHPHGARTRVNVRRVLQILFVDPRRRRIAAPPGGDQPGRIEVRHHVAPAVGFGKPVHTHRERRGEGPRAARHHGAHPVIVGALARDRVHRNRRLQPRRRNADGVREVDRRVLLKHVIRGPGDRRPAQREPAILIRRARCRDEPRRRQRQHRPGADRGRTRRQAKVVDVHRAAVIRQARIGEYPQGLQRGGDVGVRRKRPGQLLPRARAGVVLREDPQIVGARRAAELHQDREVVVRRALHPQRDQPVPIEREVGVHPDPVRRRVRVVARRVDEVVVVRALRRPADLQRLLAEIDRAPRVLEGFGGELRLARVGEHAASRPAVEVALERLKRRAVRRARDGHVVQPERAAVGGVARRHHEHDVADRGPVHARCREPAREVHDQVLPVRAGRLRGRPDVRPVGLPRIPVGVFEPHLDAQRRPGVVDPEREVVEVSQVIETARGEEAERTVGIVSLVEVDLERELARVNVPGVREAECVDKRRYGVRSPPTRDQRRAVEVLDHFRASSRGQPGGKHEAKQPHAHAQPKPASQHDTRAIVSALRKSRSRKQPVHLDHLPSGHRNGSITIMRTMHT